MNILQQLKQPFPAEKISWRVGATNKDKSKGIGLAYIDARDVMGRLDDVFGVNWQCKYTHADSKTICEIGVLINEVWVWRAGGAGDTDFEAVKGAISDAFKRAAVLFGIGRYLYDLPNKWVVIKPQGRSYVLAETPTLPTWALPKVELTPDHKRWDDAINSFKKNGNLKAVLNHFTISEANQELIRRCK